MVERHLSYKCYKGGDVEQFALLWNDMQYVNLAYMKCDERITILIELLMMMIINGVDPMT